MVLGQYRVTLFGTCWYWVSIGWYWLIYDGTGSAQGSTGRYLAVLVGTGPVQLGTVWYEVVLG